MAIGALQEASALGLRVPQDLSIVGLRRDRRRLVDEPAADDGRAADRRDRANGGRGAAEPGRAPVRAAAELRLPSAAAPRRHDGATGERRRDVVEVVERLEGARPSSRGTRRARRARRRASPPRRRSGPRSRRRRRRSRRARRRPRACTARRTRGTTRRRGRGRAIRRDADRAGSRGRRARAPRARAPAR